MKNKKKVNNYQKSKIRLEMIPDFIVMSTVTVECFGKQKNPIKLVDKKFLVFDLIFIVFLNVPCLFSKNEQILL